MVLYLDKTSMQTFISYCMINEPLGLHFIYFNGSIQLRMVQTEFVMLSDLILQMLV